MFNTLLSQLFQMNNAIDQIFVLSQIRQLIINNQESMSFFRKCQGFEKVLNFLYMFFLNNENENTQKNLQYKDYKQSIQVICSVFTLLSTAVSWSPFNSYHFFHYCDISSFILKTTLLQNEPETLIGMLFSFALNDESFQSSFRSIKEQLNIKSYTNKKLQKQTFDKLEKLIKEKFSEKDIIINPGILPLILLVQKNFKLSWHRLSILLTFNSLLGNCISKINLVAFTNSEIPSIIIKRLFNNDSLILDPMEKKILLQLIDKLCQNGLPTKDVFFLIQKFSKDLTKNEELTSFLLHLFSQNQSPSHIQFNLSLHGYSYIEFSSLHKSFPPLNGYSMLFWIRFDMFDETLDTDILSIVDNQKKYICKLFIEKNSKNLLFQTSLKNRTKFSFYRFKEGQWYHIALIHEKQKAMTLSKLSFSVNGLHIESIKCPYPIINKDKSPIRLFLGTPQELCTRYGQDKSLVKWSLSSFLIIEDVLNEDIIDLYYHIGPYYDKDYQNTSRNLMKNSSTILNIPLGKKNTKNEKIINMDILKNENITSILYNKVLFYICNDSILDISISNKWDDSEKINKKIMQIAPKKIDNNLIILNKAVPFSNNYIINRERIGWFIGNPINVIVNNTEDSIFYIGGPTLGLKLIEISKTPNDVICATKLTFSFIKNNRRNLEHMEKNHGYEILAKILKNKENIHNICLLNSILIFIGCKELDSKNSIILNPLAYKFLILDFEIWKKADEKTIKLYMQHFLSLVLKSSYAKFNIKCLDKMHIIKRIIMILKLDYISENIFPLFLITFKTLIEIYFTPKIIKMLLTYIIYALYKEPMKTKHKTTEPSISHLFKDKIGPNSLNKKDLNHNSPLYKKAIYILEMLSDILCNTQNRSFIEKFSKVITAKWLLLLLSNKDSRCVICSFKIISQLMILKGTSYISKFLPKTHYFLLIKLYLKKWWNNINIWKIAFCLFFGTDILNIKGNTDIKNFDEFLRLLLNKNKNVTEIYCFEMYDVILAMLESGAHNLKLFQTYINSTKDDMSIYFSSINVTRRRSNSLSAIYSKINKNNFKHNHIHNFKKTNYYEGFDILLYVIRFIKNMYLSIRCFKEHILSPYFIEKLLYIVCPLIFTKDHIGTKAILNSRNSFHISSKNIIIDTLPFENDHIPTLWKLDTINNSFSKCFIETISDKNISLIYLKSTITKKNKSSTFKSKLLKSSELDYEYNIASIYEILLQLLVTNVIDSIIISSKKYVLKLNIQIPLCFFGNQIYIESYILYTTLIKLHKIIQSQLDKLNEISVLSNICIFSKDCLNCALKGHFFICEHLLEFLIFILEHIHKISIKKQKKIYGQFFINIQQCFHNVLFLKLSTLKNYNEKKKIQNFIEKIMRYNYVIFYPSTDIHEFITYFCYWLYILLSNKSYNLRVMSINIWKLIIQQKFHEISSIFDQSIPSDYNIADTFLNIRNLDLKYFLSWINENKYILDNTFFKYLNTSWDNYLENQLKNWKEIILLDEQARNDRLSIQENRIIQISDIFVKHESILSNWHKNLILLQHKKIEKYIQDQIDLDKFLNSVWSKIVNNLTEDHCIFESNREKKWKLDFTEGRSRMRKKMKSDTNQSLIIQSEVQQKNPIDLYKAEETDERNINENNREILKISHDFKNSTDQINIEKAISSTIQNLNNENPNEKTNDLFKDDKSRKILRNLEYGDYIIEIHNISRINGLNAYEGILFLGKNNLYLMDNYFQKSNGEITTIWDPTVENERDLYIQLLSGKDISKKKTAPFQSEHKTRKWPFDQIVSVYRRKFLFRDVGLELFFADGQSYLITLPIKKREHVYNKLLSKLSQINYRFSKDFLINSEFTDTIKSQTSITKFSSRIINMFNSTHPSLKKWKEGKISNFHYLMIINTLTGRTYNDLTQYPIFPWVLADYTSEELDLTNPKSFRDFSKPMGAQNPLRRSEFEKRFKSFQEIQDSSQPPFHYGTHYSSAMIVCSYLIRLKPFVDSYLLLQGGSFDHADRLFYSIEKAWLSSSQENMADVRELIPEFFYLPEFLINSNNYKFGKKQGSNEIIDSVILPPWAKGDPKLFIKKHREALECDYVSEHLNEWIDLIFGFKQQGELAVKATNIFHHLSYQGSIDIDKIQDPIEKIATIGIIYNFGQTPNQIFQQPHPKRTCNSKKYITATKIPYLGKYEKNISSLIQAIMHLQESDFSIKTIIYLEDLDKIIGCSSNCMYMVPNINICLQWDIIGSDIEFYNRENKKIFKSFHKLHLKQVTCACFIEPYTLITGSNDCIIYIWSIIQGKTINLKLKNYLRGHFKPIISLDSSKSFSIIVSGSEDGLVIEWDLNRACYVRTLEKSNNPIQCISINDANGDIAACSEMTISIWTINGDLLLRQNIGFSQNDIIFSCKFYEGINYEWLECDLIFTGHNFGIVQIWNISWKTKNGKLIRELINIKTLQHYDYIKDSLLVSKITALYPSGKTRSLFTGDNLGNVYIWNLPDTVYKSHYLSSEEYNNCFICKTAFAIIDRKYNCHPCGALLCSNCIHQHSKIGSTKLCINCISSLVFT
ncbi:hypothetical protein PNEG_01795 [Pneumocystis murina B123]|uniref:Uncharacterized protein n=1 Tax=Pneumocystis murina (strain B123) TaxID=1069680 RepID=M7NSE3_PNEMU|nr:hypothetical protein PNEG_01795 [Pneumocystis murina B123]EMR10041.1 hypothetical protein PNEG_01795 [Pneumocystis murina B123]